MPKFFSQNGEDCLLWQLLRDKQESGYYVEAGALDGTRFSNTYAFELLGWSGICIEAHPDYFSILEQNRPHSQNVFAAVGSHNKITTFYTNERGSLSTLNPDLEDTWRKKHNKYFTGFKPVEVQMKTLTTILSEAKAPKDFDILSIDVEGTDFQALQGLDLTLYRPRFIIIEAYEDDDASTIESYLEKYNYFVARKISNNLIFCENQKDAKRLSRIETDCTLIYTPHPLDHNEQEVVKTVHFTSSHGKNAFFRRMIHTTKYFLRKIRKAIHPAESVKHNLSPIHETGFHGDQYLLDFVDEIVPHVDAFIETGTNMGTTIRYMAEKYPALSIFSCEPNEIAFNKASEIVKEYENRVTVYPMPSPDFLYHIHEQHSVLNEQLNLYWLDTYQHDYKRPLYEEIRFITKNQERAIIMVDDAEVPEMPQFQFSKYEGQIYNVDYIQAALMPGKTYQFIHPAYTEHTSPHHALIGVIIIAFGIEIKTNEFFNSRMITKDVE